MILGYDFTDMWWKEIFYLVNIFLGCHCKNLIAIFLVKNKLSY